VPIVGQDSTLVHTEIFIMSILFKPISLGSLQLENRFVHSATYEAMATEAGKVTSDLVERYRSLARGQVGLVIPGYLYVHPLGRSMKYQTGIHSDDMIPGLRKLVEAVHQEGGRIAFQLAHAGRQTKSAIIGQTPLGPSRKGRDPFFLVRPQKMTEAQICEVIQAFAAAAGRAVVAGVDGLQIHATHGYLVNQFLSPFFNDRADDWGGSEENRFRFLREIILAIRKVVPAGMPILVKLNVDEHTPKTGITPPLAVKYARWLCELGIDGLELSSGTLAYSFMNVYWGSVPVSALARTQPWYTRPLAHVMLRQLTGRFDDLEGFNLEATRSVKSAVKNVPVFAVGGLRRVSHMEGILSQGYADLISMSRPFVREPSLVKKIREGRTEAASCSSCNMCLAAIANDIPIRCYKNGLPHVDNNLNP